MRASRTASPLTILAAACAAALLAGYIATTHSGIDVVGGALAIGVILLAVRRWGIGVWYAVLVAGGADGLPGPNLENLRFGQVEASDLLVFLLIASLLAEWLLTRQPGRPTPRWMSLARWWSLAFMALWLVDVARAYVFYGVPLTQAVGFGRDFAYFAILVPLFAEALRDKHKRTVALVTGGILTFLMAVTAVIAHLHGGGLSLFVHETQTAQYGGITRVNTSSFFLVVAALPLGVGAGLLGRTSRTRRLGGALAVACAVDVALQLGRAIYVGEVVGVAFALIAWLVIRDPHTRTHRRQVIQALAVAALVIAALVFVHPPAVSNSTFSTLTSRATSILSGFSATTGDPDSAAARTQETSALEHILGDRWPFGMSFLDNHTYYFPGLPSWSAGSIRNADEGLLQIVMTMGVAGAALQLLPVIGALLLLLLRRLRQLEPPDETVIGFGIAGFLVLTLTTMLTQGFLYTPNATPITAALVGVVIAMVTQSETLPRTANHIHDPS